MPNFTIGLDLGQARDYSALIVTERVQVVCGELSPDDAYWYQGRRVFDEHHVRHIQRWELGTPYPVVVDNVAELLQTPDFRRRAHLVLDATGVGGAVADMFVEAYKAGRLSRYWPQRITLTAGFSSAGPGRARGHQANLTAHKGDVVARLLSLFERGRLMLPPGLPLADALEKELRAFKLKQGPRTGNLTFEAERESDHDDLVIALALSVWSRHGYDEPRWVELGSDDEPREKDGNVATNP